MEKKKYIKYTQDEDNLIINLVKEYPTNLSKAFKEASLQLKNRTPVSIAYHWYIVLKKKPHVNAVTCGSSRGFTKNVKNIKRKNDIMPEQELRHIDYVMKEILNLSLKDRRKIINFLKS